MKFKLGVVGHKDTIASIKEIVTEYFDDVDVIAEEFGNDSVISAVVGRISKLQEKCHGILYSRRDPYLLISGRLKHTIPVRYVDIDSSHFLISLLKANVDYGVQPTNISIDSVDKQMVINAFKSIGIPEEWLTIKIVSSDTQRKELVNDCLNQHIQNFQNGATLCITNITDVYRTLQKMDIPTAIINPTTESFIHEIRNLLLRHRLSKKEVGALAVIQVGLRYKEKYRFYCEMPLREIEEFANASRIMAIFAEKIGGTVISMSKWEYLLFCSSTVLQNISSNFVEIEIMEELYHTTVFDTHIGIGCGTTFKDTESKCHTAVNNIAIKRGTVAMVCLPGDKLIGPLTPKSEHYPEDSVTENRIAEIVNATGLSTSTVNNLYQLSMKRNSNLFTSIELSEELGVTTRTVNRIIERLIDNEFASVAGKNSANPKGRPARVIRLMV